MINMIILDIETSGTNPYKHSILSIGAVDFSDPKRQFYEECKIRENAEFTEEALNVNGFKIEDIKNENKKSLETILNELIVWMKPIRDKTIAGHNVNFDAEFLNYSFELYKIDFSFGYRVLDTHSLVYADLLSKNKEIPIKNEKTAITSNYVFKYVGLPEEPKPHNALNGAKMEAEAISRLILKKGLLEDFKSYTLPNYL